MARAPMRGQNIDADRRTKIGGAAPRVDFGDERRDGATAMGGNLAEIVPKSPFQRNARPMAGDGQRMFVDCGRSR